ncbi:MAG: excinuclease ABC subunit UvrC [Prevotellaceae bacterium]|jgi:excinuclease ABC subunit C|nr:excinuclease ABC subunit UvrC [Prevotellaceae bacterium]
MTNASEETIKHVKGIVENLPDSPGIYQYLDAEGTIIYVGKAKNLKRRVSSYFNKEQAGKTRVLVSKIADIRYIVVNTEEDALLLENNLIKKHKPRYNVLLKDDKTYPSICVQNEHFPRVFKTRKIIRNGSTYYGPYSHVPAMYALLSLIKHLYPIRTCRYNLTPENIAAGKFKVCLQYHIKNCAGPCVGKQSEEDYLKNIADVKEILKGNTHEVQQLLYRHMQELSSEMRFEEAQQLKEKYLLIENYRAKSEVVSNTLHNIDVFAIEEDKESNSAYINYLHITNGAINQAFTFEYKKRLNETREELLSLGIIEMRERYHSQSRQIIVPFPVEIKLQEVTFTIPQRGDKKKLLELSVLNVKQYKADRLKQSDKLNPEQRTVRLLKEIQDALQLERLPMQIECFDNSNIQGSDAVAACVVFKKGKPAKADYRKYNIRSVAGPDDYASMQEVVRRRYSRALEEGTPLPDLIITDGGKGQMSSVREVLAELNLHIPVAGLAKDNRHRTHELLYGDPPQVIGLKQNTPLFKLLTHIQDEVHRFAITFHRQKRSKRQTASELDNIKGIGEKTKTALLREYKSVKRIKEAPFETLAKSIGEAKARLIADHFAGKAKK